MGILIKIKGAKFVDPYVIDKVDIPDDPVIPDVPDDPVIPDEPDVPITIENYPVKDTLKGLYDLGGTQDEAVVDHSGNGKNASVVGSVTFEGNFAHFTGTSTATRINTGITTSNANTTTIVAMFHVVDGARSIVANYKSGGFNFTNKMVYIVAESNGGSKPFNDTTVGANGFAICAATVSPDGVRVVKYNNGAFDELVSDTLTPKSWTAGFSIGGSPSTTNPADDADIALVAIHEGELQQGDLERICEFVKTYGEQKGLTIE